MTRRARLSLTTASIALASVLVGCSSSGPEYAGDVSKYRRNPSPGLTTLANRPADNRNKVAIQKDTNWRMFWEDGSRLVLYNDRPSRLTPKPIPY